MLEKDGGGKIVASIGKSAGVIPYTCFFSTKSYMENKKYIIENFTKAIYKGQQWVLNNSDEAVAKEIMPFFPGTDEKVIASVIKNYKDIQAYAENPILEEKNLNRLMDIIQSYKPDLIPNRPEFNKIVNNEFSKKAVEIVNKFLRHSHLIEKVTMSVLYTNNYILFLPLPYICKFRLTHIHFYFKKLK